jgi:hypothetical protein
MAGRCNAGHVGAIIYVSFLLAAQWRNPLSKNIQMSMFLSIHRFARWKKVAWPVVDTGAGGGQIAPMNGLRRASHSHIQNCKKG